MPTEVSEIGPCERRISVSIPKQKVKEAVALMWTQARNQVQLKGFRPGKVPKKILEKKFGDAIQQDVKQHLVNDAYREAIEENSLEPISQPQIDLEAISIDPEQDLEFELTVDVKPAFELPKYKDLEVGAPPVNVKDEDVERELERLRSGHATVEPVAEGVAAKGDYLMADISVQVDGATVIQHEDRVVDTNRDTVDGIPTEGGTAAFGGKAVGATVTAPVHLPADFEPAGFSGAEAQLVCTIKEIRRVTLPELDDEFATKVGAESVEDLREKMTGQVQRHAEGERDRYVEERLFDELLKPLSFELPPKLLEQATHDKVHQLEHQMTSGGMAEAEAKANAASHTDRVRQEETRGLRISFLIDSIAKKESLSVSDSEIESSVRTLAAMHGQQPQDVYDELYDSGRLPGLRAQILEGKVRKLLREAAVITDLETES